MTDDAPARRDDSFELYDLRVEVVAPQGGPIFCGARPGDWFELRGEMLHLPPGQGISIYSLSSVLPLLAAKQRETNPHDWMSTDAEVACPDPNCSTRLRIIRLNKRRFSHAETTAVPLQGIDLAAMQQIELRPGHSISRVIRGNWQLATGHGTARSENTVADLCAYADAGITTFDCADIYTGVEETIGRFRAEYGRTRGSQALAKMRVHTKFVPDLDILGRIARHDVEAIVDRSLRRLGTERLDLVQFHWWDYAEPRWLDTALWLAELRTAGKIRNIGGTNFDTTHVSAMVDAGVPLASMQVQYSLLDRRPEKRLVELARRHDIALLCYGTVAGGFLSDRWLGASAPSGADENRSLTKYRLIIEDWGGWALFQELLGTLRGIADRHGTDIATVASAAMLPRRQVAAVIVGARDRSHLPGNLAIGSLVLTGEDMAAIDAVLERSASLEGDVYSLERDRHGRHGKIMKYNLNDAPGASQTASVVRQ